MDNDCLASFDNSDLQRCFYRQLTTDFCPNCGCNDPSLLELVEIDNGEMVIKVCSKCKHAFGLDDSVDFAEIRRHLESLGLMRTNISPCKCGNNDIDEFIFQGMNEDENPLLKCSRCEAVSEFELLHNIVEDEGCRSVASSVSEETSRSEELSRLFDANDEKQFDYDNASSFEVYEQYFCECGELLGDHETIKLGNKYQDNLQCVKCGNRCPDLLSQISLDTDEELYNCLVCEAHFQLSSKCVSGFHDSGSSPKRALEAKDWDYVSTSEISKEDQCHTLDASHKSSKYRRSDTELLPQKGNPGRTRITTVSMLSPGDHILWHRNYIAYHHAIVQSLDAAKNQLEVIEYTGTVKRIDGHFASVQINNITFNSSGNMMFRIDYEQGCSYSNSETLRRAQSRVGEAEYNLITNNCEHFATWCKTGRDESQQTMAVKGRLLRTAFTAGVKSVGDLIAAGVVSAAKAIPIKDTLKMTKDLGMKTANNYGPGVSKFVRNAKGGALFLGITTTLVAEGTTFAIHTHEAHKQYLDGKTSREDFERRRMKLGFESIGGFVGGVFGGIAGQFAIPIPFVGALVGSTLGSIIGRYIGAFLGKKISDKCWQTK